MIEYYIVGCTPTTSFVFHLLLVHKCTPDLHHGLIFVPVSQSEQEISLFGYLGPNPNAAYCF